MTHQPIYYIRMIDERDIFVFRRYGPADYNMRRRRYSYRHAPALRRRLGRLHAAGWHFVYIRPVAVPGMGIETLDGYDEFVAPDALS